MEDAPTTRWLSSNADLAQILQYAAASLATSNSTGPRPKVECSSVDDASATEPAGLAPGMPLPPQIPYLREK
jgi:hypothetical protein